MKHFIFLIIHLCITGFAFAQANQFSKLIKKGDSLYEAKDYKNAGIMYAEAFALSGSKISLNHRWNAASAWALANYHDSAFSQLNIMASENFKDYGRIITDHDLDTLYKDKRWDAFLELVKQNKEKAEANLNKPLAARLDSIFIADRIYRKQSAEIDKKYGWQSNESKAIWELISRQDSVNQIAVKEILDKYGWLGADVVGENGNSALFLVIQHSNPQMQDKYLPMMKEAVKMGKARGSSFALLQDRVLVGKGKMQIYGTQPYHDSSGYYVHPIEDVDNVDKRRAEMGLSPLADYLKNYHIVWNLVQYKKDLPNSPAYILMIEKAAYFDSLKK
ncbi:MAG: hypothetical protein Q8M15_02665 [Bacteroidota bacterium]|nr:hypothetical protein [Bacteroidota bacterium]